jgi:hypothetical protein
MNVAVVGKEEGAMAVAEEVLSPSEADVEVFRGAQVELSAEPLDPLPVPQSVTGAHSGLGKSIRPIGGRILAEDESIDRQEQKAVVAQP